MPHYRIYLRQEHRKVTEACVVVEAASCADARSQVEGYDTVQEACQALPSDGEEFRVSDEGDDVMKIVTLDLEQDPNQAELLTPQGATP